MHTCGTAEGVACLQQLKSGYAGITTGSCDVLLALARAVLGIALCGWRSTSSVTPTGCAAVTEGEGWGREEGKRDGWIDGWRVTPLVSVPLQNFSVTAIYISNLHTYTHTHTHSR